jgi:hydroxyacylglutathione hydrolase
MLQVTALRAFDDNYIWAIHTPADPSKVIVVDPGDAAPVKQALTQNKWTLGGILITHHHADHVGGVEELLALHPCPIFGPARENIPGSPKPLAEGDCVELLGLQFSVLDVPGHTAGHIAYVGHGAVFCGDTLFSAGCGRLFEGTPEQMFVSLSKLAALPGNTLAYCTHEYTMSNIAFAKAVEPGNVELQRYEKLCRTKREQDQPTVPTNIALELTVNPFLRSAADTVKQSAEAHAGHKLDSAPAVFAIVRAWKNDFRVAP